MSFSDLVTRMMNAGAPLEAIRIAIEAVEAERAKVDALKRKRADQKRRERMLYERPADKIWLPLRQAVFKRDGFKCTYCGADASADPHCDHIVPVSRGGGSDIQNLTTACATCNVSKGTKSLQDWRRKA